MDDDDDGQRPGKRSCTIKITTVSPQPSPTLIECPEPGCDKKYKHINGLRYHQAHAHLEEVVTVGELRQFGGFDRGENWGSGER